MVSVSQIVRNLIRARPMIYEGLMEGIISHAALAEYFQGTIERELGEPVKLPAIVMAIRRYSETLQDNPATKKASFSFNSEIIMKTGLADMTVVKSPSCMGKLKNIYSMINYDRGETLNIIHGNYEISIVITEKYLEEIKSILKDEKMVHVEGNLVSLSVSFSGDFLHTPGVIAEVTRRFAWDNINIFENISTMTELIYIISSRDSTRAYNALQKLIDEKR